MNILKIAGIAVLFTLSLMACQSEKEQAATQQYTCSMHPQVLQDGPGTCPICHMDLVPVKAGGGDSALTLDERQIALANIKVAPVDSVSMGANTFITGRLATDQELVKIISSRVPGRIERLYVKEPGEEIRKGQTLYAIYSEELMTLQQEYLLMLQQHRELGKEDTRYTSFMEAARKKLELYGMTEGQINILAESGKTAPALSFVAPASGVVTELSAVEGQYVAEGSPLYRIEGLSRLWVEAELYPREAGKVRPGDEVQVIVGGTSGVPLKARVVFLNPEYQEGSRVLLLRAELNNPNANLVPGMQASVVLSNGRQQALSLPVAAVVREENGAHVWVKTGEGTFEPRKVRTGMESAGQIAISEGIQPGDSVVISGAYLLHSEYVLKKN